MLTPSVAAAALASALALISLGGGLYEFRVVDRAWPRRPDLIQPTRGGVSRRAFWVPAHVAFELALVLALVVTWSEPEIRSWLLVGLASHATMRIWSAFDFIPKALAFERRSGDGRRSCRAQVDAAKRLAPAVGRRDLRGDAGRLCRGGAARLRGSGRSAHAGYDAESERLRSSLTWQGEITPKQSLEERRETD